MAILHSEAQNVIGQVARGLTRGEKLSAETAQELKPYLRYGGSITTIDPSSGQEVTSRVVRRTGYQGPADPVYSQYSTGLQSVTQRVVQGNNINASTSPYSSGTYFNNIGQGFSIAPSVAEAINTGTAGTGGSSSSGTSSGSGTLFTGQQTFAPVRTPTSNGSSSFNNNSYASSFSGPTTSRATSTTTSNVSKVSSSNPYLSTVRAATTPTLSASKSAVSSSSANIKKVTDAGTGSLKNITTGFKSVFKL